MKLPVRVIGAWEEMKWALKCLCLTHRAGSELRARFLLTPCGCPVLPPHWTQASWPCQAGLAPCPAVRLPRPGPEGSLWLAGGAGWGLGAHTFPGSVLARPEPRSPDWGHQISLPPLAERRSLVPENRLFWVEALPGILF